MSLDDNCVILNDRDYRVTLHAPEVVWEHGLVHRLDIVASAFRGELVVSAYENPWPHFLRDLAGLYRRLSGEVSLRPAYDNFRLKFVGDGMGHIKSNVEMAVHDTHHMQLSFDMHLDQTQLGKILEQIDRVFVRRQAG
jgi:hypothetical protein